MAVSIAGIIVNVIMVIIIIVLIIYGLNYNGDLYNCENRQSTFCYTIQCPGDSQNVGPCFGYAKMPGDNPNQWYCSNAPLTLVDSNGNQI